MANEALECVQYKLQLFYSGNFIICAFLFLKIKISFIWCLTTLFIIAILLINARKAWIQPMEMIEFQANRNLKGKEGKKEYCTRNKDAVRL